MNCKEIITGIIMPIISAIIGGGLTLFGVIITIKKEEKNKNERIRLEYEPLFYVLDPMQDYDYKNRVEFKFIGEDYPTFTVQIILKNTDKIQIVLDHLFFNGKKYIPKNGTVVDKNVVFYINVQCNQNIKENKNNNIYLVVKDLLNNEYKYELEYSHEENKFISGLLKIT